MNVTEPTEPAGRSNWLEQDLLRRVRDEHTLPVHHVVSAHGLADEEPDAEPTRGPLPSAA